MVEVNLWFKDHPNCSGIFNLGTGQARSFNDIAKTILKLHGSGSLQYIPFPEKLKNAYQAYTQANITALRAAGYVADFTTLEQGIEAYYRWYQTEPGHAAVAS